ncbi:uncharacterized protein GGS22DRAFT_191393 [Annulohypoxylon maeteangense]|uniref:uncharacterized protein n=1 Tax=Annulohypoxylon maeteangense TaxID=1927788 RepID=UPI00200876B3|nr:uncharacterized protein GGS22DRAFT_191393 [Annulohypoxylon maeteangense]KAI0882223.1 hypothetical protein GGS22DRAFT_191393 [Annulohypoxylon maeteangense]
MNFLFSAIIALLFPANNSVFLRHVGNTSVHVEGTNYWQVHASGPTKGADRNMLQDTAHISMIEHPNPLYMIGEQRDSMSKPSLLSQSLPGNKIKHINWMFRCKHGEETWYYEKSQIEKIVPSFPELFNFEQETNDKTKKRKAVYPHHFRNDEGLKWPLNKTACDNAGKARLEMPLGEGPTLRWNWEAHFNSVWPLPHMAQVGYDLPKIYPELVRIVYVYKARDNLLCGLIIHKDVSKFELCSLIEDHKDVS